MSRELGISNIQTRIILEKLVKAELIERLSQRLGHQLTTQGKEVWRRCQQYVRIPTRRIYLGRNYTLGKKDAIACVEGSGIDQLNTVVLRDEALMNGALGCTIFLKTKSEHFYLLDAVYPPLPQVALLDRKARRKLSTITKGIPWEKVVIIVGTADHVVNAQIGAIAAALLLVPVEIKQYLQNLALVKVNQEISEWMFHRRDNVES